MAAAATASIDGRDGSGYREHRGVAVAGAWRWLEEVGFGVAVEMDRAGGKRTLRSRPGGLVSSVCAR